MTVKKPKPKKQNLTESILKNHGKEAFALMREYNAFTRQENKKIVCEKDKKKGFESAKSIIRNIKKTEKLLKIDKRLYKALNKLKECELANFMLKNQMYPNRNKLSDHTPCDQFICPACSAYLRMSHAYQMTRLVETCRSDAIYHMTIIPPKYAIPIDRLPETAEKLKKVLPNIKRSFSTDQCRKTGDRIRRHPALENVVIGLGLDISYNYPHGEHEYGFGHLHWHGFLIRDPKDDINKIRDSIKTIFCKNDHSASSYPPYRVHVKLQNLNLEGKKIRALQCKPGSPKYVRAMMGIYRVATYSIKRYLEQKGFDINPTTNFVNLDNKGNPMKDLEVKEVYTFWDALGYSNRFIFKGMKRYNSGEIDWA